MYIDVAARVFFLASKHNPRTRIPIIGMVLDYNIVAEIGGKFQRLLRQLSVSAITFSS